MKHFDNNVEDLKIAYIGGGSRQRGNLQQCRDRPLYGPQTKMDRK